MQNFGFAVKLFHIAKKIFKDAISVERGTCIGKAVKPSSKKGIKHKAEGLYKVNDYKVLPVVYNQIWKLIMKIFEFRQVDLICFSIVSDMKRFSLAFPLS